MPIQRPLSRTWAPDPGTVFLDGRVDIGAAGAVKASSRTPEVIVTRENTGEYKFTLKGGNAPRGVTGTFELLVEGASPLLHSRMIARDGQSITILCEQSDGTDTDPPDGSEIHYTLTVGNLTVTSG